MTAGYLLFLLSGRLLIFFGNKFIKDNTKNKFINNLLSCNLCSGFWIYSLLSWATGYYVFTDWISYVPAVSEIIAGSFSAYLVYLVENGWRALHEVIVV
jgi:hypothetical protein